MIDIGANVGDWAANLLFFCQPDFLLCVEPDPDLANQLRRRFANRTVHVEEAAMGDSSKVAELRLMHNPALNSLRQPTITMAALFPEPFQPAGSVQVAVKTLDAVAPRDRRINLLKIDAQGFEREVLNGAKETLKRTDIVIIEVNLQPHYDGEAGIFSSRRNHAATRFLHWKLLGAERRSASGALRGRGVRASGELESPRPRPR